MSVGNELRVASLEDRGPGRFGRAATGKLRAGVLAPAVLALLLCACGDRSPPSDSSRVASLSLRAQIGANGEHTFTTISRLVATSRFLYVGQRGEPYIMVFRPDGEYVKTIGRNGGGPGEFRELARFGVLGDTLWTTDWGQRRLTLFSDTGVVLRMSTVGSESREPTDTDPGFGMASETMTPEGYALGWGGFYGRALAQGLIDSIPIMRSSWLGGASTTFAKYSIEHRDLLMTGARGTTYAPQPVPVYDFVIYDGPGSKACVVDRNPPATPTMVHAIVTCLAPSGDTLWQRTVEFEAMPLAPRIADSLRQREYTRWRPRGYLESDIEVTLHIPDHWPPVTEGLAGADGTIWLRGALANDSVSYTVITADGARETRVRASRRVRILWASGTTVWAEELDDDDVPTLSRYEVVADRLQ